MSKLQYYHGTKHKLHNKEFTLAVMVPNLNVLAEMVKNAITTEDDINVITFGLTTVSKSDQYFKVRGRDVSYKALASNYVKLVYFRKFDGIVYYMFTGDKVEFTIATKPTWKNPHLIHALLK